MANLIVTISEVQQYVRVGNGLTIATLTPAINEVHLQDMTFYLGSVLLDLIVAGKASPSARIAAILPYCMMAEASLAVYKAGPEIEVLVSDSGIQRQESDSEKTAYGGQIARFRHVAADRAFKAIDSFLKIIESNVADYPEWLTSAYYLQKKGLFLRSAIEFEAAGESIKGSALTFQTLRPIIRNIQELTIKSSLPTAMYEELLTQVDAENLSPDNKTLFNSYIAPAITKLTIEEALTTLPVEVSHDGVHVNQLELAGDARTSKMADISMLEKKSWSVRGSGMAYLRSMKDFLNTTSSSSKYPLWFNSDFYSKTLKAQIEEDSIIPSERKIYRA